jgi:uncharacterized protein GlcG (DUF336 family)
LSQAHAQGLLQTQRISAELANQAVAAVVAKCASQGYAETGVLVDADGVRQAVLRGNVAGAHRLDSAFAKAYTAASFKTDTTALVERSKTVPVLANLFKWPHLLLLGGGIVIKVGDEVVGAIGGRLLAEWGAAPAGCLFLLPLWHPVLVAEQIGTLAAIARGPFIMQCGLGWGEARFAAMGANIRTRPSAFEEALDLVRRLLAGEP